jgi:hypothetical protein
MGETVSKKRVILFGIIVICVFFLFGCAEDLVSSSGSGGDYSHPQRLEFLKEKLTKLQGSRRRTLDRYTDIWRSAEEKEKLRIELSDIDKKIKSTQGQIDYETQQSNKSCFPEETKVLLASNEYKPISAVKVGDSVLTYDIGKDAITSSPVKHIFISDNNHYYLLNGKIRATAYERFLTGKGWKKIRDLSVGDNIFNGNSYEPVTSIEMKEIDQTVYNLNIESSHNFFVSVDGEEPLLVHNSGGGGGGGGGGGK